MGSEIYEGEVKPGLKSGDHLAFGHGFNFRFKKTIVPADVNVFMVAKLKGPGPRAQRTRVDVACRA